VGAVVVVAVLVGLQLLLPRIAEHVMRERAGRYGRVLEAHVSAFPAVQLLWEHAQSASLRYGSASMGQREAVDQLWSARGIDRLDVRAASLQVGAVRLQDVYVRKRGSAIEVTGTVSEAALRAAAPAGLEVQEVVAAGERVEMRVGADVFGARISARAQVVVSEGALVVEPQGLPLGGLARVTVFADPRLPVQGLALEPVAGQSGTWRVLLRATLAGG
jgi:hypothetical protein